MAGPANAVQRLGSPGLGLPSRLEAPSCNHLTRRGVILAEILGLSRIAFPHMLTGSKGRLTPKVTLLIARESDVIVRRFYLAMAVIGAIVPWLFFGSFFFENGPDVPLFLKSLFANGAAGGFSADVLISIAVFLVWSWRDASRNHVSRWWLVLPASCLVGLSLSLPLYLYLRERP